MGLNEQLIKELNEFVNTTPVNRIPEDTPFCPELIGQPIMGEPAIAFGDTDDPMFSDLLRPEALGPQFRLPKEWLADATRVIAIFLPFSQVIRDDNRDTSETPRGSILHARIEGQATVFESCHFIVDWLEKQGYQAVIPSQNENFCVQSAKVGTEEQGDFDISFRSNWSERHVGYVCGLGTFSLTRGIITEKGTAGRVGTIVTDAPFEVTPRAYTGITEYCTLCGACAKRCPVNAIDTKTGKKLLPCWKYLEGIKQTLVKPYYGCGKCQISVPCEAGIPARRK